MMAYTVRLLSGVQKDIDAIPEPDRTRVRAAINSLAGNPRLTGAVVMSSYPGFYRIRVGQYRIVYRVHDNELLVIVTSVGGRGAIYGQNKRRVGKWGRKR